MKNPEKYTPLILRIGLASVLLWFGINQLIEPAAWSGLVNEFLENIIPAITLVRINGVAEIVMAVFLILGLFTRIVAVIHALHLLIIISALGYNDIAVRDFGLMVGAIALAFSGGGYLSLDEKLKKQ